MQIISARAHTHEQQSGVCLQLVCTAGMPWYSAGKALVLQSCLSDWLPKCQKSTSSWCGHTHSLPAQTLQRLACVAQVIVDSIMCHFRVDFTGRGELADRQMKLNILMSRLRKARPSASCIQLPPRPAGDL